MRSFTEVENAYMNHTLTEFLKSCTYDELCYYESSIQLNDIVGYKVAILDAILNEFEYRKSDNKINNKNR